MIKFEEIASECYGYGYHAPAFASDFVRQNGVYSFKANHGGKDVEVVMETGNSFLGNDYNHPNPAYEVSSLTIDGADTSLDDVEEDDFELYEAILDLATRTKYSTEPNDYLFVLLGMQEDNYMEKKTVSYDQLDSHLKDYKVDECLVK